MLCCTVQCTAYPSNLLPILYIYITLSSSYLLPPLLSLSPPFPLLSSPIILSLTYSSLSSNPSTPSDTTLTPRPVSSLSPTSHSSPTPFTLIRCYPSFYLLPFFYSSQPTSSPTSLTRTAHTSLTFIWYHIHTHTSHTRTPHRTAHTPLTFIWDHTVFRAGLKDPGL
jgi:hypothetical protein